MQGQTAAADTSASQPQSASNVNTTNVAAAGSTPNNARRVQRSVSINTPTTLFFDLQEDSDPEKFVLNSSVLFRVQIIVRTISLSLTMVSLKHVTMLKKYPWWRTSASDLLPAP